MADLRARVISLDSAIPEMIWYTLFRVQLIRRSRVARTVQVSLIDDIDGTTADETVTFGLDGATYEIDLTSKHAKQLRTSLEKFTARARRVGRGGVAPTGRRRTAAAPVSNDRVQIQAIREWAKRKEIQLSDRGRIPARIIAQYEAEAGR
jgi:Lsr2